MYHIYSLTRHDYLKNLRWQSAKDEQSASKSQARRQRSRAEGIEIDLDPSLNFISIHPF